MGLQRVRQDWATSFSLFFHIINHNGKEYDKRTHTQTHRHRHRHRYTHTQPQGSPWRRKWQCILVFLPGKLRGQRSLVGYSPWGCKESDMTERLTLPWRPYLYMYRPPCGSVVKNPHANAGDPGLIPELRRSPGEGNDNPLQYSCLRNCMDRGAW